MTRVDTSFEPVIAPDDRRSALRLPAKAQPIGIEHSECGKHMGILQDISRRGLRFRAEVCLPCGSYVLLYAPNDSELPPIRARIMRQQLIEGAEQALFEYGVQFTETAEIRRHPWFLRLRAA